MIRRALDTSPHEEQATSIKCLIKIGELMNTYPHLNICLLWLPRSAPFVGFKRARQLALEAIRTTDWRADEEPHSIKDQKSRTETTVVTAWAERWHQMPCNSLAYRTALTRPPDGQPHPVSQAGQGEAKSSRKTVCTLYWVITGHAYIGAYTQCFYPQHTWEQVACPCGEPVQTVEHILLDCPLYTAARRTHLTVSGRPRNLSQLLNHPKCVTSTIRFLEETRACARPQTEWEPG